MWAGRKCSVTCAKQKCKHNWVRLAAEVADSDILLKKHHQLMMRYAAQPAHQSLRHLVIKIDLLTDAHCNRSICAQSNHSAQMCIMSMQAYLGACLLQFGVMHTAPDCLLRHDDQLKTQCAANARLPCTAAFESTHINNIVDVDGKKRDVQLCRTSQQAQVGGTCCVRC